MSAIGRADWQVFEGDFEFLQEGDTWRVGEPFTRQYMDAVVRGRVAEIDVYKRQPQARRRAPPCNV